MSSVVRFNITQRTAEGTRVPIAGAGGVALEPTRLIVVEGDPDEMVIPAQITVPLVDGRADVPMDVTGVAWCWRIVVQSRRNILQEGYYAVPESATPLDYPADLVEVDPKTLAPTEGAVPAWEAAVTLVQASADAAAASAALASGSAEAIEATIEQTVLDHLVANPPSVGGLDSLSDVDTTGQADGDVLTLGPLGVWGPAAIPAPDLSGLLATAAAPELIRDTMASALVAGSGVTITPDDGADSITIAAAGGSGAFAFPHDTTPLDPTYGDDFDGASLKAMWTRVNLTTAEESYQQGAQASHMRVNLAGGVAFRGYTTPVPAGDFESVLSGITWHASTAPPMWGLAMLKADDSGLCIISGYNDPNNGLFAGTVTAGGGYGSGVGFVPKVMSNGIRIWRRFRYVSGTAYMSASLDGETWIDLHSAAITGVTKMGIVRIFNSPATHTVMLDRFNMRSI